MNEPALKPAPQKELTTESLYFRSSVSGELLLREQEVPSSNLGTPKTSRSRGSVCAGPRFIYPGFEK